jgi:hypothetical protein
MLNLDPVTAHSSATLALTVGEVRRGLEAGSLTVLGILVTIGLTVGFGISAGLPVRVLAGILATIAGGALIRWKPSRKALLAVADFVIKT